LKDISSEKFATSQQQAMVWWQSLAHAVPAWTTTGTENK